MGRPSINDSGQLNIWRSNVTAGVPRLRTLGYDGPMRIVFLLGLAFLAAAFLGGMVEIAARGILDVGHAWLSMEETWGTLWPDSLRVFKTANPGLWKLASPVMGLPAWLVFGLPGGLLAWFTRPHRTPEDEGPDEESLFLYDELARQAREEGWDHHHEEEPLHHHVDLDAADHDPDLDASHDDMAPSDHEGINDADPDLQIDHTEDDRAPTDHGYEPPDLGEEGSWDHADEPEATDEERDPAPSRPIPDPPKSGEGQWVPPPPSPDSGQDD